MNTLVEKMFGIIMFLAIFVPFQLGLYSSYMDAWEFTQVSSEFTQLVKEEGGFTGRAKKFYDGVDATKKDGLKELGYVITVTDVNGGTVQVGDVLQIKFKKNVTTAYNWKPNLQKTTNLTVYKR